MKSNYDYVIYLISRQLGGWREGTGMAGTSGEERWNWGYNRW
jgi:hypothetical protein